MGTTYSRGNPSLGKAIRDSWSTPKASADKMGRPRENERGDLQAEVRLWPTPVAGDAEGSRGSKGRLRPDEGGLARAAKETWHTPNARDWKSAQRVESEATYQQLGDQVWKEEGRTKDPLNPDWTETLMGYPPGWTNIGGRLRPARSSRGSRRGPRPASSTESPA